MSKITKRNQAILKARNILANLERYIVVSSATSELNTRGEVIELCAMSLQGEILFDFFFNPQGEIYPEAIAKHGLTQEILKQNGAITWDTCEAEIYQTFADRIMLAYNARREQKVIEHTAALYDYDSPIEDAFCVMALYQQFSGRQNTQLGDRKQKPPARCAKILEMLREIATAEFIKDPEELEITNNEQLVAKCRELEKIKEQRLALAEKEELIRAKCGLYLKKMKLDNILLENGQKVELWHTITRVKSRIPVEDLAARFKTIRLNQNAVQKLWQDGKLDDGLFRYEETWSIKIKSTSSDSQQTPE
ncbi:MAG: 3'-5' exonuclease [Cyanobacteria bacterium J06621_8]